MIISVRDLQVTYEGPVPVRAVRGVTFHVDDGEFVSIVGPSGSGKSSILYVLGALQPQSAGQVTVCGVDLSDSSESARNKLRAHMIGFVFQEFHLLTRSTVLENVAMGSLYAGVRLKAREERALRLLDQVGIGRLASATPRTLSGGEKQRTAIARALMGRPRVLLCDEPTGNLDRESTLNVIGVLNSIRLDEGPAVVVVTHDPEVQAASDRALTLRDGVLVGNGPS